MKKTLITGINGQDGSYIAELLLDKGYEVHGIIRREAAEDVDRRLRNIKHLLGRVKLHICSIDNHLSLSKIVDQIKPDECYHLAASSFVSYSFDDEISVLSNNFHSTHFLLSSIKELVPECRFYFAGSSEMFGDADVAPQNENTKFNPRSIYGISKVAGYYLINNYRRQHKIFACSGILYNHESPRRGYEFVTRKITSGVAKIYLGLADKLELGNIDAQRDWGYAPDYVEAMWLMLNNEYPNDYIIATNHLHSVKEFLEIAFSSVNLKYEDYVKVNPIYFRPQETVPLCGDYSKARSLLGWKPKKDFRVMVEEMVENDIKMIKEKI